LFDALQLQITSATEYKINPSVSNSKLNARMMATTGIITSKMTMPAMTTMNTITTNKS